jgi:hypothetical protein
MLQKFSRKSRRLETRQETWKEEKDTKLYLKLTGYEIVEMNHVIEGREP